MMSVSWSEPKSSFGGSLAVVTDPESCLESDFLDLKKLGKCKFIRRVRIPESEVYSLEAVEVLIEDEDNEFPVALICSAASRREMKALFGHGVPKVLSCISVTEDVKMEAFVSWNPWSAVVGCSFRLKLAD